MLMQAATQKHLPTEHLRMQLRILTGVHAGACVALPKQEVLGVYLSNHMDADIWITDASLFGKGNAWLYANSQCWILLPEAINVADAQSWVGDQLLGKGSMPLGSAMWLGDVSIVVCEEQEPWQDPKLWMRADASKEAITAEVDTADELMLPPKVIGEFEGDVLITQQESQAHIERTDDAIDAPVHKPKTEIHPKRIGTSAQRPIAWATLTVGVFFLSLLVAVLWWSQSSHSSVDSITTTAPISEELKLRQVQEARMVIALVDPSLQLQIVPIPQGGVRISGWLLDQQKLDQLVQALAGLRPLPQIALRTMADLNDVVQEVGYNHGLHLLLRPQSQGSVQVSGLLWSEDKRQKVINDVRERLPDGMQLEDGLYAPAAHLPIVTQWLKGLGFHVREVAWEKEMLQLNVQLRSGQRRTLEQALLRSAHPLQGIPFRLRTADMAGTSSVLAKGRLPANSTGVPIAVRTIVGGAHPYVVTLDGKKLQPGARVGEWRLVEVASGYVIWDGPQRLEVAR